MRSCFFTGLLDIGYEVLVVRILSQVMENTIFSFAGILSVYLLGLPAAPLCIKGCRPGSGLSRL